MIQNYLTNGNYKVLKSLNGSDLGIYKVAIKELHLGTGEQARKYESNLTDSK